MQSRSAWPCTAQTLIQTNLCFKQCHNVLELHVGVDLDDECLAEIGYECEFHLAVVIVVPSWSVEYGGSGIRTKICAVPLMR